IHIDEPKNGKEAWADMDAAEDPGQADQQDSDLASMNSRYAVVRIGGKTRVVTLEDTPTYPGSGYRCSAPSTTSAPSTPSTTKKLSTMPRRLARSGLENGGSIIPIVVSSMASSTPRTRTCRTS